MRNPSETREKLLDTAIELIWQSNYANVGINEICDKAGTTKGAFYHHFDSKATLFEEATTHYWERTKRTLDAIYSPERSALEQLEGLIDFIVAKQTSHSCDANPVAGCPFFTSGAQCGAEDDKVREASRAMSEKAVRYNAVLVKNLQAESRLASDCDPEAVGRMMHQFTQGLLLHARLHRDPKLIESGLREGLYRLLDLKPEHRGPREAAGSSGSRAATRAR